MTKNHKPLTFATSSSWKYQQGEMYLQQYGITCKQAKIELPESRSEDVTEIAREKAIYAYELLKQPVIVIDGAFHITALNGFPKTMVKFSEKYIGASGIMKLMKDAKDRTYKWTNVLCYRDDKTEKWFTGYITGKIVEDLLANSKTNDFGQIQLPDGYTKTFSEMTSDELHHFEKHVWSPALFEEFARWYR